jgi:hypothetical protein
MAYERSCQRYAGIVQSMAEPDPLRMLYRDVIALIVKTVVEQMEQLTAETIAKILETQTYHLGDRHGLQALILKEFTYLHEGNVGRYGLTPSQYYQWKAQ